jgi:type VI secretion system protein ImpH
MATAHRTQADPVSAREALRAAPQRFTLFAALRALEALNSERPRIGTAPRPANEAVRLAQRPHLHFPATEVASLEERGRWYLEQYGFGLFGPNGALPLHLTELVFDRAHHFDDTMLRDFINAFQHRWIALFYRAWLTGEPATQADRPEDDEFLACLQALVGLDAQDALGRGVVSDAAIAGRPGLFTTGARSAEGLERLLSDYFQLPFRIRPYVARWLDIPSDARLRLGGLRECAELGRGATLGTATWQVAHSFELVIGPVDEDGLTRFLPGSRALAELRELVRRYTNDEWQWQLRVLVERSTVPGVSLGAQARLGQTSWIGQTVEVAGDVVLQGG